MNLPTIHGLLVFQLHLKIVVRPSVTGLTMGLLLWLWLVFFAPWLVALATHYQAQYKLLSSQQTFLL